MAAILGWVFSTAWWAHALWALFFLIVCVVTISNLLCALPVSNSPSSHLFSTDDLDSQRKYNGASCRRICSVHPRLSPCHPRPVVFLCSGVLLLPFQESSIFFSRCIMSLQITSSALMALPNTSKFLFLFLSQTLF